MTQFNKDMASPYRSLFQEVRTFLLATKGIVENQKPRITTFSDPNGGICHLRTMPHGIDIGFLKGSRMEDTFERLTGKGKAIRVLSLSDFDPNLVGYYLDQAIRLNHQPET
ncbi:DUF1801 domain-containing protein [Parasulfitobacter algicola]|uniref:DUF1801 domain-containing protein n=1 Tax=Parasulfitobacter algicola TaxID=2614809 RepID=A0ABX2IWD8_9RHOB|nr:DUF1801 domain-containing protein [Sulfitobacter algicola]NSX54729.1 DUF1801 domain-containing protein [Sulfitobacter algicola]